MTELKLTHLHAPDQNWAIRICRRVATDDGVFFVPVTHSVVKECEECGAEVWYNTAQQIPPLPDGEGPLTGECVLCLICAALHIAADEEEPTFLGPKPPGF